MEDSAPVTLAWVEKDVGVLVTCAEFKYGGLMVNEFNCATNYEHGIFFTEKEAELLYSFLKTRFGRRR